MADSIFDLFNLDELQRKFNELTNLLTEKYNDFVENNIKKYDLNTDEGYEAFIKEAAELRKELTESDSVFSEKMLKVLDLLVEKAMKKHNEKKHVEEVKKELVANEVSRVKEENHGKVNVGVKNDNDAPSEPEDWPSDSLTYKQSRSVWKLVDEYMETMIEPYCPDNTSEDVLDDMASGLYEFAAWLLNHEDK